MKKKFGFILSAITLFALGQTLAMAPAIPDIQSGVAVMHPTKGSSVKGTVRFVQMNDTVRILIDLKGFKPNTTHGFHIHQYGDCTALDATSAGGHYAPEGHKHGGPEDAIHHAGDLGNIQADANGEVHTEMTVGFLSVAGINNPVLGRAVIVHAEADDLKSQPTGAAGARLACGVIGIANPELNPLNDELSK